MRTSVILSLALACVTAANGNLAIPFPFGGPQTSSPVYLDAISIYCRTHPDNVCQPRAHHISSCTMFLGEILRNTDTCCFSWWCSFCLQLLLLDERYWVKQSPSSLRHQPLMRGRNAFVERFEVVASMSIRTILCTISQKRHTGPTHVWYTAFIRAYRQKNIWKIILLQFTVMNVFMCAYLCWCVSICHFCCRIWICIYAHAYIHLCVYVCVHVCVSK